MTIRDYLHENVPSWLNVGAGMSIIPGLEYFFRNPHQIKYAAADASFGAGLTGGLSKNPGLSILGYGITNAGPICDLISNFFNDVSCSDTIEKLVTRGALFTAAYIGGSLLGRIGR